MNDTTLKQARLRRRQARVRAKITGTAERPRLAVRRSLKAIACQLIDDVAGKTIVGTSDRALKATGTKTDKAKLVGAEIAKLGKAKGVTSVVFDRGGRSYHGRVQALADAAREGGLQF